MRIGQWTKWKANHRCTYNFCNRQMFNTKNMGWRSYTSIIIRKKTIEKNWKIIWACKSQKKKWPLLCGKMLNCANNQRDGNFIIKRCHFTPIRLAKKILIWQYEVFMWRYKATAKHKHADDRLANEYNTWERNTAISTKFDATFSRVTVIPLYSLLYNWGKSCTCTQRALYKDVHYIIVYKRENKCKSTIIGKWLTNHDTFI